MKTRSPIPRIQSQPQKQILNSEREFSISSGALKNISVMSVDGSREIGNNPILYLSESCDQSVGFTITLIEVVNKFENLLDESVWHPERIVFKKLPRQYFESTSGQFNTHDVLKRTNWAGEYFENHISASKKSESIILIVLNRIYSQVERQVEFNRISSSYQITFPSLFQIAVGVIEVYNEERKYKLFFNSSVYKSQFNLSLTSSFYASIICEKKLFWVNLKSHEVFINKHGICYKGRHFIPTEERDLFLLKKLFFKDRHSTVTVYTSPKTRNLFWIESKRMILLKEVSKNKSRNFQKLQIETII